MTDATFQIVRVDKPLWNGTPRTVWQVRATPRKNCTRYHDFETLDEAKLWCSTVYGIGPSEWIPSGDGTRHYFRRK